MSKSIVLARGITLPLDVVTQAIGIIAKRRVGKSYTARRLAEQVYRAGVQLVIVDPKGDHWGIRSAADGKAPGLPIVILGGEHGDVPLEVGSGELVAKLVVEERASVLLDLSLLRKHEVATFMSLFLETLYRLKAREQYRTALFLILEEADAIAPQKPAPNEARMLGAADDIVRRGGQRGIGVVLVTQRSAVINKNVLTQCEMLVALRTIAPQDREALEAWIEVHGTKKQRDVLMESLASLPKGDAWFWSPGWPTDDGIFRRAHVLPIETFDSGKSPEAGEKRVAPKQLADVDLGALTKQMAATIERAKQDDPKLLRKEVAELRGSLKKANDMVAHAMHAAPAKPSRSDVAAAKKEQIAAAFARGQRAESKRWRQPIATVRANVERVLQAGRDMIAIGDALAETFKAAAALVISDEPPGPNPVLEAIKRGEPHPDVAARRRETLRLKSFRTPPGEALHVDTRADANLSPGERAILIAAAQAPDGVTKEHLTVAAGYKKTSRDVYVRRLKASGYVQTTRSGSIVATQAGIAALGADYEPLPTGVDLRRHWLARLPEGERKILALVCEQYPNAVSRETIGDETQYKKTSRDVYIRRLQARELVAGDRDGVTASSALFE